MEQKDKLIKTNNPFLGRSDGYVDEGKPATNPLISKYGFEEEVEIKTSKKDFEVHKVIVEKEKVNIAEKMAEESEATSFENMLLACAAAGGNPITDLPQPTQSLDIVDVSEMPNDPREMPGHIVNTKINNEIAKANLEAAKAAEDKAATEAAAKKKQDTIAGLTDEELKAAMEARGLNKEVK